MLYTMLHYYREHDSFNVVNNMYDCYVYTDSFIVDKGHDYFKDV